MHTNDSSYVDCRNGVFTLPDAIYHSLASFVRNNFVYLRDDEDGLTISTSRLSGGRRRLLNTRFRTYAFRDATRLAIVDLKETLKIMAVESRP